MSLKILLADDSMTAQNMGKKILADAGCEVIAVSNGAAAVKKIAETKPEIIILDIYMPGYTGLEVCEKVKANPDTANVPVILTVGKLEPYRPEDGAKVKAEGVIIKPFEATDLLTTVGKIAAKYGLKVPSIEPIEIKPREHQELPHDETYHSWKKETPHEAEETQSTPPAPSATPVYEKTLRMSAKDMEALLEKGTQSEAAKAAAMAAAPVAAVAAEAPKTSDGDTTQKLDVPQSVRDQADAASRSAAAEPELMAPAPAIEIQANSTPMFAIDDNETGSSTPSYTMSDFTGGTQSTESGSELGVYASSETMGSSMPSYPEPEMDSPGDETSEIPGLANTNFGMMAAPTEEAAAEYSAPEPPAPVPMPAPSLSVTEHDEQHELETFGAIADETAAHANVDTLHELETTANHGHVEVEHFVDPALVTTPDELMQFTVKVGTEKEVAHDERDPFEKAKGEEVSEGDLTTPEPEPEPEVPQAPHSYEDDPLVQMGVISIDKTPAAEAPETYASTLGEPEPSASVEPYSAALAEESPATETVEEPYAAAISEPEPASTLASLEPVPMHVDDDVKKFGQELHEAISQLPSEPHVDIHPEPVPELLAQAAVAAPDPHDMGVEMAAASAQFADKNLADAPKIIEPKHDHELAASLSAALESVERERTELPKAMAAAAGLDATQVASAVQRVFDRYREKMISDITSELTKNQ